MPKPPSKWKRFKSKYENCRKCKLCETRRNLVLARGQLPADVVFIGEAPGKSENTDRRGRPFHGPAGKRLDRQILEADQMRYHDFEEWNNAQSLRLAFTNLTCCIPWADDGRTKVSEPPDFAVEACAPRLAEFIGLACPKLIVYVGRVAAKLSPSFSVPSVEIIHPAAILKAQSKDPFRANMLQLETIVTLRDAFDTYLSEE